MHPNVDLDLIGGLMGTDKSSADHNYLVHYDRLFNDIRHDAFNFLEIGIFKGASLATWRRYFERATIIGVDIQESCRQFATNDIIVEIGSQDDPGFLVDLGRRYPPRVVIDDGSHMAHHVIYTFETLFPAIEPGGIYIVEDMHFHAGAMESHTRGPSSINPIDYFMSLSKTVLLNELEPEKKWGFQAYAQRTIDEIVFFGHAAAIRKKTPKPDQAGRLNAALQFAEESGSADAWERTSKFLAGNGDREAAISALRAAIKITPAARFHRQISALYASTGNRKAAIDAARPSLDAPADVSERAECLEHFGNVLAADGQVHESVVHLQQALEIASHPVVRKRIEQKIAQLAVA